MSRIKRWLEQVSEEIGHGGGINDEVLAEGQRRLDAGEVMDEQGRQLRVSFKGNQEGPQPSRK